MPAGPPRPRLLIFVIAYEAEDKLAQVLDRIPRSVFDAYEVQILVVDDASQDRTADIGRGYRRAHPELPLRVLRNEFNQGYGGNQKVGYLYATRENFDLVAMLHGDGQYAPEKLPDLLAPFTRGEADAVFGTRMAHPQDALKGGMPLYKFVGNRILSTFQNAVLRQSLSEFHSGYRVYSVATLKRLPLQLNTNDFHFDTEIIIQLLAADARIVEVPIPTYYGDEISRVNGMRYAADVARATAKYALHRSGVLHQRRFDVDASGVNSHYTLKLGYESSHSVVLDRVPAGARVIDLGGGSGLFAAELVKKGCQVTVVDQAPRAPAPGIEVVAQNLDDPPRYDVRAYDYILLLDVIEHLAEPERFLAALRRQFDYHPRTLLLTTPNVAFGLTRLGLLFGEFNYGKAGILDLTHRRLFTFRSLRQLLGDAGFKLRVVRGIPAPFEKALGPTPLAHSLTRLNTSLIRVRPELFAYQVYVEAEGTPDTAFVLDDTLRRERA
jgi:glycosyltransferase involved in cell wall biosynthesis